MVSMAQIYYGDKQIKSVPEVEWNQVWPAALGRSFKRNRDVVQVSQDISGCHWRFCANPVRQIMTYSIMGIGVLTATLLILGFNGVFGEVSIPLEYNDLYE